MAVLVFFGFVATVGSAYVHTEDICRAWPWLAALPVGLLACALLVVNNLRDIGTDAEAGKRTLAVRLGAARTRVLFRACIVGAFVAVVPRAGPPAGRAGPGSPPPWPSGRCASSPRRLDPPALIAALVATARLQLLTSALLAGGLWLAAESRAFHVRLPLRLPLAGLEHRDAVLVEGSAGLGGVVAAAGLPLRPGGLLGACQEAASEDLAGAGPDRGAGQRPGAGRRPPGRPGRWPPRPWPPASARSR